METIKLSILTCMAFMGLITCVNGSNESNYYGVHVVFRGFTGELCINDIPVCSSHNGNSLSVTPINRWLYKGKNRISIRAEAIDKNNEHNVIQAHVFTFNPQRGCVLESNPIVLKLQSTKQNIHEDYYEEIAEFDVNSVSNHPFISSLGDIPENTIEGGKDEALKLLKKLNNSIVKKDIKSFIQILEVRNAGYAESLGMESDTFIRKYVMPSIVNMFNKMDKCVMTEHYTVDVYKKCLVFRPSDPELWLIDCLDRDGNRCGGYKTVVFGIYNNNWNIIE